MITDTFRKSYITTPTTALRGKAMPFCPRCGKEVTEEMNICPYCGNPLKPIPTQPQPPAPAPTMVYGAKNPGLAALLSIIPGLGQLYDGRIARGLIFLFLGIPVATILAAIFFWTIVALFLPLIFWIWNIFDAYNLAVQYNRLLAQTGRPPW